MRHTWLLCVLAVGCGPSSFGDFRAQLDKISCDRDVKCGLVAASERDRCASPDAILTYAATVDLATVDGELKANRLQFFSSGAQACLDAVRGAACRTGHDPSGPIALHCHHVVGPGVATGGACQGPSECIGGICVAPDPSLPGTCVEYPGPGAPCDPSALPGTPRVSCDPSVEFCGVSGPADAGSPSFVCTLHRQPGEKCAADEECGFGYVCTSGACHHPPTLPSGSACDPARPLCRDDALCTAGTCQLVAKAGAPCSDPRGCRDGLACIGLTLDGSGAVTANGTCGRWIDAGQPCTAGPTVTGCAASDTCAGGTCTAATP